MVRPTHQEMIAIEKIVILGDSKRRGHATPWKSYMRKHQSWSEGGESKQQMWARACTVVSARRNRQGRENQLRIR